MSLKQLEHDNIVPFYGISTTIANFCLVFPWYRNGNITEYVKQKPGVNRFDLVSTFGQSHTPDAYLHPQQLSGAASGLKFIHDNAIYHGALRPVRGASFSLMRFNAVDRVIY